MTSRTARGFTLVELILTAAVMTVISVVALPAFTHFVQSQRASSARYRLTYALASARMAAVMSGRPVSVCPVDDSRHCRTDGIWDQGWMTFRDPGRLGHPRDQADVLSIDAGTGHGLLLRSTAGRKLARFQNDGRSGGSTLTLSLCASQDHRPLGQVILNNVGRTRTVLSPVMDTSCAQAS